MTAQICNCGLVKQKPSIDSKTGLKICTICNHPLEIQLNEEQIQRSQELEQERLAKLSVFGRSATHNREIIEQLINELAKSRKYAKAIKEGDFTTFSFVGTNDWEDYASLSLQALNLLAIARIDENLEKIRILLEDSKKP
jgi:uncharacterized Zn finger protein (UPF0148 family)